MHGGGHGVDAIEDHRTHDDHHTEYNGDNNHLHQFLFLLLVDDLDNLHGQLLLYLE